MPAGKVCLTVGFFGMHNLSNLIPRMADSFEPSRHMCRGDVLVAPPGLLIIIRWTKTLQCVGKTPVLRLPAVQGHPANPLAVYRELLTISPTVSHNQLLLTVTKGTTVIPVNVSMLARALAAMLQSLGLNTVFYSLHSPRRGRGCHCHIQGSDRPAVYYKTWVVVQHSLLVLYNSPMCLHVHLSSGLSSGRSLSSHFVMAVTRVGDRTIPLLPIRQN